MWTKDNLSKLIKEKLGDYQFISVSNREPYIHELEGESVTCKKPTSGLVVALDPVMKACGGLWIAYGSGNADRAVVDNNDSVMVPPDNPMYRLRRVWMTPEEENLYYNGFANQALWPLCHVAYTRPYFNEADWDMYKKINQRFADIICKEIGKKDAFVFIQDYHFALLPKMIKDRKPNSIVAQFWHIPWPNREAFRICPWRNEILEGMLGNDLLGFHLRYHCQNYLDTISSLLEAKVDYAKYQVTYGGKKTTIRDYPISIDYQGIEKKAKSKEVEQEIKRLKQEHNLEGQIVALGIDRVDYTKGIKERIIAIDRFLEKYPKYIGKFTFINLGGKSRFSIPAYRQLNDEIYRLVYEINLKYKKKDWVPIIFHQGHHVESTTLTAYTRLADICIVSSLHDGMNLVAKEYVASQVDGEGVLILSQFTGAARELTDAIMINPYSTDAFAEAIKQACSMRKKEKQQRMVRMQMLVKENNIYLWAGNVISDLFEIEFHDELLRQ